MNQQKTLATFNPSIRHFLSCLCALLIPLTWALPALSIENVDLGSSRKEPINIATGTGTLRVGGQVQTVASGTMLTDAQMAAFQQVMNTGRQQLILGASGNAIGGRVNLSTDVVGGINNLVIPRGVTAVNDFGKINALSVAGNLTNAGRLIAYTSNAATTQNLFNAQSLTNLQTGLISNSLAGVLGVRGIAKAMDLNFNVLGDFVNHGRISSTGALNITAGGSIMNLTAPNQTAPSSSLAAMTGISLASSAITNSGMIQSTRGNINFVSPTAVDLIFSNAGGTVRAPNGVINFRDANFFYKNDLNLLGGDLIAKTLNLYSGNGTVSVDVGQLLGRVNIYGGIAHLTAATPKLHLGDIILTGDPTFYNTVGDVVIDGNFSLPGQALAIVAGGDILSGASGGFISTANAAGNAGQINLVAGAQFSSDGPAAVLFPSAGDTTSTITITGGSTIGGKIDLTTGTPVSSISSSVSGAGNNAADINLIAFAGTNLGSGTIKLPSTGGIAATANAGKAGNVNIIAGAASSGNSIELGFVTTQVFANNVSGNIFIATKSPTVGAGVTILNGLITSGNFAAGTLQTASISSSALFTTAGVVTVESGRNVAISSGISVSAGFPTPAGSVSVSTKSSTPLNVGSVSGANFVQSLSTAAGSGNGANISLLNSGSGGITLTQTLDGGAAVAGNGGSITLDATINGGTGNIFLQGAGTFISAQGGGGAGGSISLKGSSISSSAFMSLFASGNLAGGNISITTTGANADILASLNAANNFSLQAVSLNAGAPGGSITLNSSRDVLVNTGLVLAFPNVSGEGADLSFTAGRNISIQGPLSANAKGAFKGGSIFLSSHSSSPFQVFSVSPATNGVTGAITANAGSGDGGSVTVINRGSGGISHILNAAGLSASPAVAGNGGTIMLDALQDGGSGAILLGSSFTLNGNAIGAGARDGGFVAVRGSSVQGLGNAFLLVANGSGTGKGGQVELKASDSASDLVIANLIGGARLQARGTNTGKGGSITVDAGQDIILTSAELLVAPTVSGSGGAITLNAGRNVNITGALSASAIGTGDGGSITIRSQSSSPFTLAPFPPNLSPNGSVNNIVALGAGANGKGGSISIFNSGSGGITHNNNAAFVQVNPSGSGDGGSVTLDAASNGGTGTVSLGAFFINANTNTGKSAGNITIKGESIVGPVGYGLSAGGGTVGKGGVVTVQATGSASDLLAGFGAGSAQILVQGGSVSGNAGEIILSAGRDIDLTTGGGFAFTAVAGDGAKLTFNAGRNVDIDAGLNVDATTAGNGGSVSITSNSATTFTVNGGATNRVNGNLSAKAVGAGAQGSITVINNGTGGLFLNAILLSADGAGNSGNTPGAITLSGATISGAAGLSVDAGTDGIGGNVFVTTTDPTADIDVPATLSISAFGGTATGDGGSITLKSGRDLNITDAGQLGVAPTNGSGGHLDLEAGRNIAIANNLVASSNGTGTGGSVRLVSNSTSSFVIGGNTAPNFVQNTILALAATDGDGGEITIINKGSGGISHQNSGAFTNVTAAGNGKGGTIVLDAQASGGSGTVILGNNLGPIFLNAQGAGTGNGGTIEISAADLSIALQTVNLNVLSLGGQGGTVSVTTTDASSDIKIQAASGLAINASGATDAGTVNLSAGHNLSIIPSSLNIIADNGSIGNTGNGASINLSAGSAGAGNVLILGSLVANGTGNGKGGQVFCTFNDATGSFNVGTAISASGSTGSLTALGAGTGAGGLVSIDNLAPAGISMQVVLGALNTTGSDAGLLSLQEPGAPISITSTGQLNTRVDASASSFSYSNSANNTSLLLNNIVTTGDIDIVSTGTGTTVSLPNGGTISSSTAGGVAIVITAETVNNNGTIISGNGAIQLQSNTANGLTLSGLGHISSFLNTNMFAFAGAAPLVFAGSHTFSGSSMTFQASSITLDAGVSHHILSDSSVIYAFQTMNLDRTSRINGAGMTSNQLTVGNFSIFPATIQVEDGFSASIITAGGPISVFSNNTLTLTTPGASSVGTLNLLGGPVNIIANNTITLTATSLVNSDQTIEINPVGTFTNNGTIRTSATGDSIVVQAIGALALAGVGAFNQTGALASITSFSGAALNLANGLQYSVTGPSANLEIDSAQINVTGGAGATALFIAPATNIFNSGSGNAIAFAGSGTGNNLNFSGGDVLVGGGDLTIGADLSLSQVSNGRFQFNLPASKSLSNNGTISTSAVGGFGIDIQGAGDLSIFGAGNYLCNGTDELNINAVGNILLVGTINSVSDVTLTADTGSLTFGGNQTFNGVANLSAGQSVVVQNAVSVQGNQLVDVISPLLVLQGTGTISGNPLSLQGPGGAGTIANASGDVTLPANLIFAGRSLSILASGNVLASTKAKSITLSSKSTGGGSLFIAAGFNFTPSPIPAAPGFSPQTFTLGSASATGGSVLLPLVNINTSSTSAGKVGGNVLVLANAGPQNAGTISLGSITSSATSTGVGGSVTLIGEGGVQTGKIVTTGASAGSVVIRGAQPVINGGNLKIVNGTVTGSGLPSSNAPVTGTGAAVFVNGAILANGLAGKGGAVDILADAQIELAGNVLASGSTGGGSLSLGSLDSFVTVQKGGINTSGLQITSALSAGVAGSVDISGPAGITVNGSLLAAGGSNKGTGNAGAGGSVSLTTTDNNPNTLFINNTKVAGLIDTRGGSALGGGTGGAGGNLTIETGTLQVTQSTISINASAGTGGAPVDGLVDITTYASQAFPANFDLLSTKTQPALPGGMFTVGTANPVNGTAGNVVSGTGSVASKANAARIVDTNDFVSPKVLITVTGAGQIISTGPVNPDNGAGVRVLVTPSQAVALFQKSLTGAQTINLSASGQALTGSTITVQPFELPAAFTAFTLQSVDAPTNGVTLTVQGIRPILSLPASKVVLAGTLQFAPGSTGMVDFGTGAVNLPLNSTISGSTLILSSKSGTWASAGLIQADNLILAHPASSALVFTLAAGGTITGAPGSVISLTPGYMPSYSVTFKAKGANFSLPVEFDNLPVPTAYKSLAQSNASKAGQLRPVVLSFALTDPFNQPTQAVVQGNPLLASTITISSLKNTVGAISTNTPLLIADNTVLNANTALKLNSVSSLTVGDNVDMVAGVLKSTAPASGLLSPTNIAKSGSITISGTSISLGSNGSIIANGGNLVVTATTGNMSLADAGLYQSNGGSISMLAMGTVTGGSANNFYARGMNLTGNLGGTIEVGSGLVKATNFSTIFKLPKGTTPVAGSLGSGVVINNTGTGAVATNITGGFVDLRTGGVNPASLDLTGGAILIDALGSGTGKSVQFDGVIMKTESLKLIGYTESVVKAQTSSRSGYEPGSASGSATSIKEDRNTAGKAIGQAFMADGSSALLFEIGSKNSKHAQVKLHKGSTFVHFLENCIVSTACADIHARKGALLNLSMESGILRVIACSGPGHVSVKAEGLDFDLPPANELVLGRYLDEDDIQPADGIGRRSICAQKLPSGRKLAISEVSLITMLANAEQLLALRKPRTGITQKLQTQVLKTAAALQHVQSTKGPYKGRKAS